MNKAIVFLFGLALISSAIPVYLMLPLTLVNEKGLQDVAQLKKDLAQIKAGGIKGVMTDVWWGLSEPSPKTYNFTAYKDLAKLCQEAGLKLQVVMSFHQCGGNVGDTCNIPIPQFVHSVGDSNPDIYYRDSQGKVDKEYISLGVDHMSLFNGRTPLEMYRDFMKAFVSQFSGYLGSTIDGVSIGLGPASELRYPGYQTNKGWSYCGVGEFQCNDAYMLADLRSAAQKAGHSEWGNAQPNNAGSWNSHPSDTGFFSNGNDNYASDYGKFFLSWYSEKLIQHGEDVLSIASNIFPSSVALAAKVSGIHWWYQDGSHAAELTSGYYNTNGNDAYGEIAKRIGKYVRVFDFTCMEMFDSGNNCGSAPATLVKNTIRSVMNKGMLFDGENALELCSNTCSESSFDQIYKQSTENGKISHFTYLRLTRSLMDNNNNWNIFTSFVRRMNDAN